MVNRDRVQLLVDALESDEFGQCKGALRRADADGKFRYCCLGVATEVALRNGLPEAVAEQRGTLYDYLSPPSVWNHNEGQLLSDEVMEWYGFDERSPMLSGEVSYMDDMEPTKQPHLAHHWNDSYNADFRKIAAMFRERFLAPETPTTD